MKNSFIALFMGIIILSGCSNSDKEPKVDSESLDSNSDSTYKEPKSDIKSPESTSDLTDVEAYNFAQELFKKIDDDEQFLKDAFELKEYNTLSKYVSSDWIEYTDQPHRYYPKAQVSYGSKYFPESDAVSPYTACDTAFRDLYLYANAMQDLIREDTATLRKILRQEEDDYLKSKARCKERIDMTYKQALTAEENE